MSRHLVDADFSPEFAAVNDYRTKLTQEIVERVMFLTTPFAVALVLNHLSTNDLETVCRFLERRKDGR